jgi:hypothetical protein
MTSDDEIELGTNLYENACLGVLPKVRGLLGRGANVNFTDIKSGCTALTFASGNGHVDVVGAILNHEGVDVNMKDKNGDTALIEASRMGHLQVVLALLNHNGVDMNVINNFGWTALTSASEYGRVEVVRALLNHEGVDVNIKNFFGRTALDEARIRAEDDVVRILEARLAMDRRKRNAEEVESRPREEDEQNRCEEAALYQDLGKKRRRRERSNRKTAGSGALQRVTGDPRRRNENCPSSDDADIEQDRRNLRHVMETASADPVELSLAYIKRCIKKDYDGKPMKLGSGGFGDVFLAEDSCLPKKFAVKMIRPTPCDQDTIEELQKKFQTELSVSSVLCVTFIQR